MENQKKYLVNSTKYSYSKKISYLKLNINIKGRSLSFQLCYCK